MPLKVVQIDPNKHGPPERRPSYDALSVAVAKVSFPSTTFAIPPQLVGRAQMNFTACASVLNRTWVVHNCRYIPISDVSVNAAHGAV